MVLLVMDRRLRILGVDGMGVEGRALSDLSRGAPRCRSSVRGVASEATASRSCR